MVINHLLTGMILQVLLLESSTKKRNMQKSGPGNSAGDLFRMVKWPFEG